MKICRITPAYLPYELGGGIIFAENITKELAARNYENIVITIIPNNGDSFAEEKNIKVFGFSPFNIATLHNIRKKNIVGQALWTVLDIYSFYSYQKIREILVKEKPDVVHVHTPIGMTLSVFAAAKSLGLPVVFTLHDYLLLCRRVTLLHASGEICTNKNVNPLCRLYRVFTRGIINNKVDVVTAPSKFILDIFGKNGFFHDARKIVLPHGVEINIKRPDPARDLEGSQKTFNILYVGGLTINKGVQVLLNAFKQINNEKVNLHIVGSGVYENDLKKIALNDRRIFFHGKFPHEKIQEFYAMADVLVVPSIWYETFGRVILEAFNFGVPVICSNIGGMPELIADNYNGVLFEAGDMDSLQKVILKLIAFPEKLKMMKINACETAKKYPFSKSVDALIEIYNKAIETNRSRK